MNLTKAIERAMTDLMKAQNFNGLNLLGVRFVSEDEKRASAADDGRDQEWIDSYVNDYAYCGVHLDAYDLCGSSSPYVNVEFDRQLLHRDFKEWILKYLDGDESVLPKEFDLEGGDMEFMKPGYGER